MRGTVPNAGAEMVVVGARGRGRLAWLLLGSVSSQVAAYARGRVVAVVQGHWRPAAGYVPGPVVVGVDGSAASQEVVAFAAEEAALRGAALLAVCALADSAGSLGGAHLLEEEFEQVIAGCEKNHPEVAIRRQVGDGAARAALLTAAQDAQMLVVGSRGRGVLRGMMLGSVSQAVLHHASCPVGVVHPRWALLPAHGRPADLGRRMMACCPGRGVGVFNRGEARAAPGRQVCPGPPADQWPFSTRAPCPGKSALRILRRAIAPISSRPYPTGRLLCGHHYLASRRTLAAAGAAVFSPDGRPVTVDAPLPAWSADSPAAGEGIAAEPPGTRYG